ncbi:MAG: hypothetical protein KDE08_10465 [Rhodobacteraceae bacterium]|nr:hypothetical protein [Paracoccaceae bacterium]
MSDLIRAVAPLLPLPGLVNLAKVPAPTGITPAATGADSGGNMGDLRSAVRTSRPKAKVDPPVDPDRPTGPPPAFEANVLDARGEPQLRREPAPISRRMAAPDPPGAASRDELARVVVDARPARPHLDLIR